MEAGTARTARARRRTWRHGRVADYVEMTKPKVQSLLLFTTATTMYVAGDPSVELVAVTCLGGALSAGGANASTRARPRHRRADGADRHRPGHLRPDPPRRGAPFGVAARLASFGLLGWRPTGWPPGWRCRHPLLRLRLHQVVEAHDAAEHRHRRRGRGGAAAGRLGGGDRRARGTRALRGHLHLDAAALLGAGAAEAGRVRAARRCRCCRWSPARRRRAARSCSTRCCSSRSRSCRSAGAFDGIYLAASITLGGVFFAGAFYLRAARAGWPRCASTYSLAYLALLFGAMVADARL